MNKISKEELTIILDEHEKWLEDLSKGKRAQFKELDLSGMVFKHRNLTSAVFSKCDLTNVSFGWSDLSYVGFFNSKLVKAIFVRNQMYKSNFAYSDLSYARFTETNLRGARFEYADLSKVNFTGAILLEADFVGAKNTDSISCSSTTDVYFMRCPEEGEYIGFKKAREGRIVKLLIPADAKRSSATSRKCRASKAKVLSITDGEGLPCKFAGAWFNSDFIYKVGETVEVSNFDENRWKECSTGIHHFLTREEAEQYTM